LPRGLWPRALARGGRWAPRTLQTLSRSIIAAANLCEIAHFRTRWPHDHGFAFPASAARLRSLGDSHFCRSVAASVVARVRLLRGSDRAVGSVGLGKRPPSPSPPAPVPLRPAVKDSLDSVGTKFFQADCFGEGGWRLLWPCQCSDAFRVRADCGDEMRTPKSAKELGEMIATWLCIPSLKVSVHPNQFAGWEPRVIAAPAVAAKYQPLAEEVATDLRRVYELSASN
jgi:hypothetical protein